MPLWALKELKCNIKQSKKYRLGIYSSNNELPLNIKITPEFCKVLGYFAAEGHSTEHDIVFSFGEHERGYINEVKKSGKMIDEKNFYVTATKLDHSIQCIGYSIIEKDNLGFYNTSW